MHLSSVLYREWEQDWHLRHIDDGEWVPMYDSSGNKLDGIEGKHGVRGRKKDGSHIGADFIRMRPGSAFPLHMHEGDHVLNFIEGSGFVHINGENIPVSGGHMIYIPAEYAHGVWVADEAIRPLIFFAAGHPHEHVDSRTRMWEVNEQGPPHYLKSLSGS